MARYRYRARGHEYMDELDIDGEALFQALRELEIINRYLGGHRTSILGIEQLLQGQPAGGEHTVLDIGAGGADTAVELERWGRRAGWSLRVVSLDINPSSCRWALERLKKDAAVDLPTAPPLVVAGDVFRVPFRPGCFDIVHSSLFLHHFDDDEAVLILRAMRGLARIGVVINDLHRHPLAYWSVRLGSALLSRSAFVQHDGPLSVLRGFRRDELENLADAADACSASLCWRWGFRWGLCLPTAKPLVAAGVDR